MKLQRTFILSALVLSIAVGTVAYADEYATTTAISISTDNEEVMPEEEFIEDIPETDSEYAVSSPEENEVQLGNEDIIDPNEVSTKPIIHKPTGIQGHGYTNNLEYYYHNNGYPEYISYVYGYDKFMGDDGEMYVEYEIGLTDLSEKNRNEILNIASDKCYISFAQDMFSFNYRTQVYEEMRNEFTEAHVRMADDCGRIYVYAPEGKEKEYLNQLGDRYFALVFICDNNGDFVYKDGTVADGTPQPGIEAGNTNGGTALITPGLGVITTTVPELGTTGAIAEPTDQNNTRTILIIAISAALVLLITGGVYLLHKSKMRISSDGTVAASVKLTNAEIERAVADSIEKPSSELKDRIMREIK